MASSCATNSTGTGPGLPSAISYRVCQCHYPLSSLSSVLANSSRKCPLAEDLNISALDITGCEVVGERVLRKRKRVLYFEGEDGDGALKEESVKEEAVKTELKQEDVKEEDGKQGDWKQKDAKQPFNERKQQDRTDTNWDIIVLDEDVQPVARTPLKRTGAASPAETQPAKRAVRRSSSNSQNMGTWNISTAANVGTARKVNGRASPRVNMASVEYQDDETILNSAIHFPEVKDEEVEEVSRRTKEEIYKRQHSTTINLHEIDVPECAPPGEDVKVGNQDECSKHAGRALRADSVIDMCEGPELGSYEGFENTMQDSREETLAMSTQDSSSESYAFAGKRTQGLSACAKWMAIGQQVEGKRSKTWMLAVERLVIVVAYLSWREIAASGL